MADEPKGGNIHVEMGDGNSIGQIGHNFFASPPPDRNSIWINGQAVGIAGAVTQHHLPDHLVFEFLELTGGAPLEVGQQFLLKGVTLQLAFQCNWQSDNRHTIMWDAVCRVLS